MLHPYPGSGGLSVSPSDYKDGLIYITDLNGKMGELESTRNDGLIEQSKMLWAFGNFLRFVRPGMRRVGASIQSISDPQAAASSIMISAYKDIENKKLRLPGIIGSDEEKNSN